MSSFPACFSPATGLLLIPRRVSDGANLSTLKRSYLHRPLILSRVVLNGVRPYVQLHAANPPRCARLLRGPGPAP
ncbi:hypothetical protein GY45DRAFT_1318328 [Cubamyces sp. BRFM 1775]|nr:hypothetical protein GY45DRAFT_1318328 [Cubamyces sp. BRFM 1775]